MTCEGVPMTTSQHSFRAKKSVGLGMMQVLGAEVGFHSCRVTAVG